MTDTTENTASEGVNFTPGEAKLILSIIEHLQGDINTDFAAVATQCGYKDKSVARKRWTQIRAKKLGGAGTTPAKNKPRTPAKKRKAETEGAEEDEEGEVETPVTNGKGAKKGGRKVKKVKTEPTEGEGEEVPATPTAAAEGDEEEDEDEDELFR